MSLLDTMSEFVKQDDKAERAAFEKAMTDKLSKDKMTMGDLFYEVYLCQKALGVLEEKFNVMLDPRPVKEPKVKKGADVLA